MFRFIFIWGAALFGVVASAASASTLYVPLAAEITIADNAIETVLTVSNHSGENRSFTTFFVPNFKDGVERPEGGGASDPVIVPPYQTVNVSGLSGGGGFGMLEVNGDDELVYSAFLETTVDDEKKRVGAVPLVTTGNVFPAGASMQVLGWRRSETEFTSFGLVNLSQTTNSCNVRIIASNGALLINPVTLALKALSTNYFLDALKTVGIEAMIDARVHVSCDGPAYAFSHVFDVEDFDVFLLPPAMSGAAAIPLPGEPIECGAGAACFSIEGSVHQPSNGNRVRRVIWEPPVGTYQQLTARIRVTNGGWAKNSSGTHNIFWLVRDNNKDMYGYVNVKGPGTNEIFNRQGFGIPQGAKSRETGKLEWPIGVTFDIIYVFNGPKKFVDTTVLDLSGNVVAHLVGTPNVRNVHIETGNRVVMDIGFDGSNPSEPPTLGWRYAELQLELTP